MVIIIYLQFKRMNINFIRNLSDQILRQNQQLKTEVILAKQRLSDFQEQIINAVSSIHVPLNIGLDAPEALRELIKTAKELNSQKNILETELQGCHSQVGSLKFQLSLLESENQCRKKQTQLLKRKEQQLIEERKTMHIDLQREKQYLQKANEQLSRELIQLKEQLRLQKLMLIESKRRQIEEIRQYHLKQLLEFRERSDKQVVQIEKQMQQQVSQKDKVIRNLQKAMEKLSNSAKLDDQESEVLVKLFKSFQQYNQLSKALQERSQQIFKFRQHVQQLECGRIKLQSKLKEVTMNEMNLNSQIQRLNIMKRDLQNKLEVQTKLLIKSEQDKDIMEQYYDKKWNQEYKKVKLQLQKAFAEKIKAIEQQNSQKMQQINGILIKSQQQLLKIQIRNKELQEIFLKYQQEKSKRDKQIRQREETILRLYREKNEVQLMSLQEIRHLHLEAEVSKISFQAQINSLNQLMSAEKQLYDEITAKHRKQLSKTTAQFTIKIQKIIVQKQKQKKFAEMHLQKEVLKLKDELIKKDNYLDNIKINLTKQIQTDIVKKAEQAYRQSEIRSRQKQEQLTKKSDRWANRLKQVEAKYSHLKKKTEQEHENFRKEIMRLDAQNRILQAASTKFQEERRQFMIIKNDLLIKSGDLEKKVAFLNGEIRKREQQKCELQDMIDESNIQITQLKEGRKIWLTQLNSIQKSYSKQFDSLKKTHEKQLNLLKSKIWQLQQICKKRPIKRKDYERLQQMQKERRVLQNQIYLKQAENIILNQVKGYYQNKFRQQQDIIHIEQPPKTGHAMTNFKLKLFKKTSHTSHKFSNTSNTQLQQSKQMVEMRKYIAKSAKKYPNLALTKPKFQQLGRYHRFNTTHD